MGKLFYTSFCCSKSVALLPIVRPPVSYGYYDGVRSREDYVSISLAAGEYRTHELPETLVLGFDH